MPCLLQSGDQRLHVGTIAKEVRIHHRPRRRIGGSKLEPAARCRPKNRDVQHEAVPARQGSWIVLEPDHERHLQVGPAEAGTAMQKAARFCGVGGEHAAAREEIAQGRESGARCRPPGERV